MAHGIRAQSFIATFVRTSNLKILCGTNCTLILLQFAYFVSADVCHGDVLSGLDTVPDKLATAMSCIPHH
jgi:hypothetical protein